MAPSRALAPRPLVLSAAAIAVVALVAVFALSRGVRQDGPVPITDAVTVEYEYAAGEATTWGTTLPAVGGSVAARLISVEPIGVSGLDVIGIAACDKRLSGCAVVNERGWPLPDVESREVAGLTLHPAGAGRTAYQLLVGVRRHANADVGTLEAIRLVYEIHGTTYEVTEPWSLRILAPGTLAVPTPPVTRFSQAVSQPASQLLATLPKVAGGEGFDGIQVVNDAFNVGHPVDDVLSELNKERREAVSVFRWGANAEFGATTVEGIDGATLFEAFVVRWNAPAVIERRQRLAVGTLAWELRDRGGRLTVLYRVGDIVYLVQASDRDLLEAILLEMPPNGLRQSGGAP